MSNPYLEQAIADASHIADILSDDFAECSDAIKQVCEYAVRAERFLKQELTRQSTRNARLDVLDRIADRGRNYFVEKNDTHGVDLFEHFQNELRLLRNL